MNQTPKGVRPCIGLVGRRNVGKSALVNALTGQEVSIVSPVPGTTTDPVDKSFELPPLGAVVFVDTAGLDDEGALGGARTKRSEQVLQRLDLAVLVVECGVLAAFERELLTLLKQQGKRILVVFNKRDQRAPTSEQQSWVLQASVPSVEVSATALQGIEQLGTAIALALKSLETPALVADLVRPGDLVVLVVPVDVEAPKGRLILPQAQTIREVLDAEAVALVVKERELGTALKQLNRLPSLVVTDSQAFLKVAADVPESVPLTSFSILMARAKGELDTFLTGVNAIDRLQTGDKVLVAEACSHKVHGEDIGTVKIPRFLTQYSGAKLRFDVRYGQDFPEDLASYKLIVHCGACMLNRAAMLSRLARAEAAGVAITNYGLTIAHTQGILKRALGPFPALQQRLLR